MLILVAHGSRDPRWRAPLEDLAHSLSASLAPEPVRVAFMQFTGPTLAGVAEEGIRAGEGSIRILPLFMASAGHVEKDVRPVVEQLAMSFPDVRFELLTPVGEDPLFPGLITEIMNRASEGSGPR